jgi:hypothetical protein
MGKLLQLGVDPRTLYEQFRERSEQREMQQEETKLNAQEVLTQYLTRQSEISLREYRLAREAEASLVVEPELPLDEMGASDYRKTREAGQRGETPRSYRDYLEQRSESK